MGKEERLILLANNGNYHFKGKKSEVLDRTVELLNEWFKNKRLYLNLTNGIEFMPYLSPKRRLEDIRFCRIQSTWCEQKEWSRLLLDLDYDLLMSLAMGVDCVLLDGTAKGEQSRAIWQGLPFISYVLTRLWLGQNVRVAVGERKIKHDTTKYFNEVYDNLDEAVFRKLNYFQRFVNTDDIKLDGCCMNAEHDNDYAFYADIIHTYAKCGQLSIELSEVFDEFRKMIKEKEN